VRKGFMSSLHWHKNKDETFIIIKGEVQLEVGGPCQLGLDKLYPKKKMMRLKVGDAFRLEPGTVHRFQSISNNSIILEVSTHHEDEDSIKIKVARALDSSVDKGYTNKEKR
jgi:mannose-6-phosphate isomerase-like protein (cupin superfamily)